MCYALFRIRNGYTSLDRVSAPIYSLDSLDWGIFRNVSPDPREKLFIAFNKMHFVKHIRSPMTIWASSVQSEVPCLSQQKNQSNPRLQDVLSFHVFITSLSSSCTIFLSPLQVPLLGGGGGLPLLTLQGSLCAYPFMPSLPQAGYPLVNLSPT